MFHLDEYCRELTNQVTLRRDQLSESIRQHADLLVQQIERYRMDHLTRANENDGMVAGYKLLFELKTINMNKEKVFGTLRLDVKLHIE